MRASNEEILPVNGPRELWLIRCQEALAANKFTEIVVFPGVFQLQGIQGYGVSKSCVLVTLLPDGVNTLIHMKMVTHNCKSPGMLPSEIIRTLTTRIG